MIACRLFDVEHYREREADRIAAINKWRAEHPDVDTSKGWPAELRALNDKFFPPGSMWFCPWYHDPKEPGAAEIRARELARPVADWQPGGNAFLSIHYWRDWADKRAPITVVGPNRAHWCVDQGSSNGTGWKVTGEAPAIVAHPSIWLRQGQPDAYHGWLGQGGAPPGVFSNPV